MEPSLVVLPCGPEDYRRAAAFLSAYSFSDPDICSELLDENPVGLACALTIFLHSALARAAEQDAVAFSEELQELAVAVARFAAAEES